MKDSKRTAQRVSLTKKQLQEGVGAELFSLCQAVAADGQLSREEILELSSWLADNRDAELPGITFLAETLERIVADGRVSQAEQRELLVAIERVLPSETRKAAKGARRQVEDRKAAAAEAQERRNWPDACFDFMVAGVPFEGRSKVVEQRVREGESVRLVREPNNRHDRFAVHVRLCDGASIGYVPRDDAQEMADCLDSGWIHSASIKKVLRGGRIPIPVVVAEFHRPEKLLETTPEPSASSPAPPVSQLARDPRSGELKPRVRSPRVRNEQADAEVADLGHGAILYAGLASIDPTVYVATKDGLVLGWIPEPHAESCRAWMRRGGVVRLYLFEFPEPSADTIYCGIYLYDRKG